MPLPTPEPGLIIRYAYLWRSEASQGEEEGRKDRPCAVVLAREITETGEILALVAPITHTPPGEGDTSALAIPARVKQRLGLDEAPSWIITRELNSFSLPGPDLRPIARGEGPAKFVYGHLPQKLTEEMIRRVVAHVRTGEIKQVRRTR